MESRLERATAMRKHRRAWLDSELTRKEYALRHGLAISTFYRWLRRLSREGVEGVGAGRRVKTCEREVVTANPAQLVPVHVVWPEPSAKPSWPRKEFAEPTLVEVELVSGVRLRVPAGYPLEYLSEMLRILERAPC